MCAFAARLKYQCQSPFSEVVSKPQVQGLPGLSFESLRSEELMCVLVLRVCAFTGALRVCTHTCSFFIT